MLMTCAEEDNGIVVRVRCGEPWGIQCCSPQLDDSVLEQLPASVIEEPLGPRGADVEVVLPRKIAGRKAAYLRLLAINQPHRLIIGSRRRTSCT